MVEPVYFSQLLDLHARRNRENREASDLTHSEGGGIMSTNIFMKFGLLTALSCLSIDMSSLALADEEAVLLDEIVVTAQKRGEQSLQDVPISISVLGGNHLDAGRFQGVVEALGEVAGVSQFTPGFGGGSNVNIRGVAASSAVLSGGSTVGYYLDDAPFGFVTHAISPDASAYDIERVEVLRGPQGTLYGASALNGVVRVLTNGANLDEYEFKARTSISNTENGGENFRGDLAFNVPLVDGKLALRGVVGYNDLSGWIDKSNAKDFNDAELQNYRLKINARPSDSLFVELSLWNSHSKFGGPSVEADSGINTSVGVEPIETEYDVYGLKIAYDFSSFTVSSSTSYLEYNNSSTLDLLGNGALDLDTIFSAETFSQEIHLFSTNSGSWQWSVGGLYRDAEDDLVQALPIFAVPVDFANESKSYAVFGELNWSFLDGKIDLTGGLRYFEDEVSQRENQRFFDDGQPLFNATSKFDSLTPRAVLTWHASDGTTAYASYSQGFRSGFSQNVLVDSVAPGFPPVMEDTLINYELGAKGSLSNDRINYNVALYYIDWQDVQQIIAVAFQGVTVAAPVNGEAASGFGLDVGVNFLPTDNLQLGLTFSRNDLTMDSEVRSDGLVLFEKGERLNNSAEFTAGINGSYTFAVGNSGFEGRISGSASYVSELKSSTVSAGAFFSEETDDLTTARLSFSVVSPQKKWSTMVFVDNAFDESGATSVEPTVPDRLTRLRPRTVGIQVAYQY